VDPVLVALTGPGQPFEIAETGGRRLFRRAPATLSDLIDTARRFGAAEMIVDGERRLSYDETFRRADALAGWLADRSAPRVAIAMRNSADWMIAFLAIVRARSVAVLLNSRAAADDLRAQAEECAVSVVLADDERARALRGAGYGGAVLRAEEFPTSGQAPEAKPADPDDPIAILFTSGTTGRTKGAILTNRNLITGLMCVQLSGLMVAANMAARAGVSVDALLANRPQQAFLLVYPLFHISGLGSGFVSQILGGGKIVVMPRWDPREALNLIARERVTMFAAVPTMLWDLIHRSRVGGADLSSLSSLSSGGQALPINLLDEVSHAFPSATIGTGFGLTETAGAIAMAIGGDFLAKPASSGRVLALADVRTLDDSGRTLPTGEAGEIVVRGPMVMQGYWNRPEDTAAVLDADGWFHTGDIGYVDDDGYIFIVDRKKDMVISGGENIYCAEVERAIGQMPEVGEVAAFGVPDERLGERLVAVVVADGLDERRIQDHVADSLARYKAPTRVVFSREPLPRNVTGKIDKRALRAQWPALLGEA
jgi:acyl-CoA synthetase (AMP-forming)/AMP-acid ligase II